MKKQNKYKISKKNKKKSNRKRTSKKEKNFKKEKISSWIFTWNKSYTSLPHYYF